MLDLFAMLKKGHCDGIKVRIGRLQNLLSSSCMGMFYYILLKMSWCLLIIFCFVKEHLDFMNNVGTNHFDSEPFKQLEYDYSGYQSLTDVPKALVYTEDIINIQVNKKYFIISYISLKKKKKN